MDHLNENCSFNNFDKNQFNSKNLNNTTNNLNLTEKIDNLHDIISSSKRESYSNFQSVENNEIYKDFDKIALTSSESFYSLNNKDTN